MKIKFVLDKRTEVMEILLKLTNYFRRFPDLYVDYDLLYIKDVEKYFIKYKKHKAVKLLQKVIDKFNFCYDAPINIALRLNEDFSVDENKLKGYPFETRLKKDVTALEFLKEIKNFVLDTNFEEFYNNHKKLYNTWLKEAKNIVNVGVIDYLNEFYKEDLKQKYIINLIPLHKQHNFAVNIGNKSICNLGIKIDREGKLYFTRKASLWIIQHEFSHPIINPLTEKYIDTNKVPKFPEEVVKVLEAAAYTGISNYVNEQVIRATTIMFYNDIIKNFNEEAAIRQEEGRGFIHTRRILKALKKYRKQSEPMSVYYPKILKEFYKPLKDELKKLPTEQSNTN